MIIVEYEKIENPTDEQFVLDFK
ncbi:unnamed protein product, partial [Rotaria sp. Silwood1]